MLRRQFLGGLSAVLAPTVSAAPKGAIIEMRRYQLRNSPDMQMARISEFVEKHAIPAAKRTGGQVAGAFSNLISPDGPFLLLLNTYPSLAAMETSADKLARDKDFSAALDAYYGKGGLVYQRVDVSLLRCFDSMPAIEPPPIEQGKAPRVFELRIYESNNPATLRKKAKMFAEDGEIAIFKRVGIRPVFFATALTGSNLPNLTYLVAYDDLAAREKAWKAFLADPEWIKLRGTPGLSDAEIVSNISNTMLRPLPFSAIR